jgi:hypothetical protein
MLYDMFICGMNMDEITVRSGVPGDYVEMALKEVELKEPTGSRLVV